MFRPCSLLAVLGLAVLEVERARARFAAGEVSEQAGVGDAASRSSLAKGDELRV